MKVALVHVPYEYRGGEDQHVQAVERIYQSKGWEVVRPLLGGYLPGKPALAMAWESLKVRPAPAISWGQDFIREIEQSDFVHLHNPYPILGVHFLEWCRNLNKKILWTIHNHRFFCTNGLALREGKICRDCFSSPSLTRPILHNCNESLSRSTYYSFAIYQLRRLGLLESLNIEFLAPSPYMKGMLESFGIDAARVHWVPNPISLETSIETSIKAESIDVLYCGRLSQEKGIETLVQLASTNPELKVFIAGDGPLRTLVEKCCIEILNLKYLGKLRPEQVSEYIKIAKVIVLPSICNEILPTFLIEGLISGKKCIATSMGSLLWFADKPFFVNLFRAGDVKDLSRLVRKVLAQTDSYIATEEVRGVFSDSAYLEKVERVLKI